MAGNINIGSSVIKREAADFQKVTEKLASDGWKRTGSLGGGMIAYYQKSGINITVLDGPMGTLIFPSGPLRGRLLGDGAVGLGSMSTVGIGTTSNDENPQTTGRGAELV